MCCSMVSSCKRIRNVKSETVVTECGGAVARCFFPQEIIKRLRAEEVSYNPLVSEICHADFAADKGTIWFRGGGRLLGARESSMSICLLCTAPAILETAS
jgi:hypothetical protein